MITRKRCLKVCNYCNKVFLARLDNLGKFCSISCSAKFNHTKHGLYKHPIYKLLIGMKTRCYNINNTAYKYYGGRGIKICDEWLNDSTLFYNWCINNGYKSNLEIDRIDNNGNYSSSNCRFTTKSINMCNRSLMKNNKSGYTGILFDKQTNKWRVIFKRKTILRTKDLNKAILKRKEIENVWLLQ